MQQHLPGSNRLCTPLWVHGDLHLRKDHLALILRIFDEGKLRIHIDVEVLSQDSGSFFLAHLDRLLCRVYDLDGVFYLELPFPYPVDGYLLNRSRLVRVPNQSSSWPHDMFEILPAMWLGDNVLMMLALIALKAVIDIGMLLVKGLFQEWRLVVQVHTSMS